MKWVAYLSEIAAEPDEDLYMIGHSAGCITILRYLETIDRRIGGAVLVAGFQTIWALRSSQIFSGCLLTGKKSGRTAGNSSR
jgi:predicted alpha/beta hydrolase family esterase